jgi:hypothetical protein
MRERWESIYSDEDVRMTHESFGKKLISSGVLNERMMGDGSISK